MTGAEQKFQKRHCRLLVAALLMTSVVVQLPPAASAQSPETEAACPDMVLTDPTGDQLSPDGPGTRPYHDIEALFFAYEGSPASRVTANLVLNELTGFPPPWSNPRAAVIWDWAGRHRFVRASGGLLDSGLSFHYGNFEPATQTFDIEGETPGLFHEGQHGIMEIDIPTSIGGELGMTLSGPYVVTYEGKSTDVNTPILDAPNASGDPVLVPVDRGPDTGTGDDFTVGDRAAGERGSSSSGDCAKQDPVPPQHETSNGPCTKAAAASMPDGGDHDHKNVDQHRFACGMQQVFSDSLAGVPTLKHDVVLGEMDIEQDLAAIAVAYPESGILFFDVSNPAEPLFLSHYRGSLCDENVICGAFVDLSSDGTLAFLSVQSAALYGEVPDGAVQPGEIPDPAIRPVSEPGVEVIDVRDRKSPRLTYVHPVLMLQPSASDVTWDVVRGEDPRGIYGHHVAHSGVHTSRSHVIPDGPSEGARAPGEYLFSVANHKGLSISRVDRLADGHTALTPVAQLPVSLHDMFVQNDSLTGRTYLYIAAAFESGFYMYDVTNPATPVLLAEWDLTPECQEDWYSHTIDVAVRDGRRYVTIGAEVFELGSSTCTTVVGNGDRPGPLWIVDATVPSQLGPAWDQGPDDDDRLRYSSEAALVATWTNPADRAGGDLRFSPHNQQIVGDLIYLSHYHGGVYVLDASDAFRGKRNRPRELGFIVPQGDGVRPMNYHRQLGRPAIWDVVHHKGYALAADMFGGLHSLQLEEVRGPAPPS